jgi:hypothetical protein
MHGHARDRGAGRLHELTKVGHLIELDLLEQVRVGFIDQRLDVQHLLFGEIFHQLELAFARPGRVAKAVVRERHRRGQHREDQGVHEQQAPHPRILPFLRREHL